MREMPSLQSFWASTTQICVQGEDEKKIEWSVDRIRYWLSVGAVPSKSVVKLLEAGKILSPDSPYSTAARLRPKYPVTPEVPIPSEETTPATEATS
ncbi:hypothetical protein F5146DRAFT_77161 [Armillaria mellea]|nr:hypothetical protein F5146DRAFT_77161 [Armillaria mellea]